MVISWSFEMGKTNLSLLSVEKESQRMTTTLFCTKDVIVLYRLDHQNM